MRLWGSGQQTVEQAEHRACVSEPCAVAPQGWEPGTQRAGAGHFSCVRRAGKRELAFTVMGVEFLREELVLKGYSLWDRGHILRKSRGRGTSVCPHLRDGVAFPRPVSVAAP